jgi:hypothetical protein
MIRLCIGTESQNRHICHRRQPASISGERDSTAIPREVASTARRPLGNLGAGTDTSLEHLQRYLRLLLLSLKAPFKSTVIPKTVRKGSIGDLI